MDKKLRSKEQCLDFLGHVIGLFQERLGRDGFELDLVWSASVGADGDDVANGRTEHISFCGCDDAICRQAAYDNLIHHSAMIDDLLEEMTPPGTMMDLLKDEEDNYVE